MKNLSENIAFDQNHIWHPYASCNNPIAPLLIEKAQGVYLFTANGEKLIDGMSSWWSAIHGYNHPVLNKAINEQLGHMSHVMFGGLTHKPAIELADRLLSIVPKGLNRVFYADSGSVAVEVALKMAIQYQHAVGRPDKCKFVSIRNGYHGDTWHTMSVSDPENGMHHIFSAQLPKQLFIEAPESKFGGNLWRNEIEKAERFIKENRGEIAGFILEPIVQGAGGMRFYHPKYLKEIRRICSENNILLIADEIATGFGRSGKLFACEHAGISPDIMCLGKAITGGYMSFAATLCSEDIAQQISNNAPGVFMHGPTFMGNPLACSVANSSIDLLLQSKWQEKIQWIERSLSQHFEDLKNLHSVADVRCLGAIGVIEMREPVDMKAIQAEFIKQGIWMRPFGKLIYTMPPYIIDEEETYHLCQGISSSIKKLYR